MDNTYHKQVELLIRCIPIVNKQTCFALKGGTAINLFVRDMPRLSIDIDLVYLPIESRAKTLIKIESSLKKIARDIQESIPGSKIRAVCQNNRTCKLIIRASGAQIKIEPNTVQRGVIFNTEELNLCPLAEKEFELTVATMTMAKAELYGSKITAALDRQHPRDLFDVMLLLNNEGITSNIRKAFIVYLASHPRPMNELLNPNKKDIEQEFKNQFLGMTTMPITLQPLLKARDDLINQLNITLTNKERLFLLSLKMGEPDWSLANIPKIETLPAVQWKLANIGKINVKKHKVAVENLKAVLKL